MIYAVKDMKKIWCPKAERSFGCECVGPKCGAWRWWTLKGQSADPQDREGYCGLAGKPAIAR
jgi:hypothetical protein